MPKGSGGLGWRAIAYGRRSLRRDSGRAQAGAVATARRTTNPKGIPPFSPRFATKELPWVQYRKNSQPRWGCGKSLRLTLGSLADSATQALGRNPFGIEVGSAFRLIGRLVVERKISLRTEGRTGETPVPLGPPKN